MTDALDREALKKFTLNVGGGRILTEESSVLLVKLFLPLRDYLSHAKTVDSIYDRVKAHPGCNSEIVQLATSVITLYRVVSKSQSSVYQCVNALVEHLIKSVIVQTLQPLERGVPNVDARITSHAKIGIRDIYVTLYTNPSMLQMFQSELPPKSMVVFVSKLSVEDPYYPIYASRGRSLTKGQIESLLRLHTLGYSHQTVVFEALCSVLEFVNQALRFADLVYYGQLMSLFPNTCINTVPQKLGSPSSVSDLRVKFETGLLMTICRRLTKIVNPQTKRITYQNLCDAILDNPEFPILKQLMFVTTENRPPAVTGAARALQGSVPTFNNPQSPGVPAFANPQSRPQVSAVKNPQNLPKMGSFKMPPSRPRVLSVKYPQSPHKMGSLKMPQSPPKMASFKMPQSPPRVSAFKNPQSPPKIASFKMPQSPPKIASFKMPQSPPKMGSFKMPQSPPHFASPQSPPRLPSPQTPPRIALPQTPPRIALPQTPPRTTSPQTPPRVASPRTPPRIASPQTPPRVASPRTPPRIASPRTPPRIASPRTVLDMGSQSDMRVFPNGIPPKAPYVRSPDYTRARQSSPTQQSNDSQGPLPLGTPRAAGWSQGRFDSQELRDVIEYLPQSDADADLKSETYELRDFDAILPGTPAARDSLFWKNVPSSARRYTPLSPTSKASSPDLISLQRTPHAEQSWPPQITSYPTSRTGSPITLDDIDMHQY
jgi:hypothetical protein